VTPIINLEPGVGHLSSSVEGDMLHHHWNCRWRGTQQPLRYDHSPTCVLGESCKRVPVSA